MPGIDNFYSDEAQNIIGKAPSWVVRRGVTIVFAIFGGILLGCYFIQYPDIVTSSVRITTYNPPVDLISRHNGLIDTFYVADGDIVNNGDLIAVLESSADWNDVQFISEKLDALVVQDYSQIVALPWLNKKYNLGDLQAHFSVFQKNCIDYNFYLKSDFITKKKDLLNEQIIKTKEYYTKLKKQYNYIVKDLEIQTKFFQRDSILYEKDILPLADFEIASQKLIQKQSPEAGFDATLTSTELQIIQLEQQVIELSIQQKNEISEYEHILTQNYQELRAEIAKWKKLYTLIAPTSGQITFVSYWNKNQHVKVADKLASIIPQNKTQIIGRVEIPSMGFGKIRIGQTVNIKLNGYPYIEFGVLKGVISSLSAVPEPTQDKSSIIYMAEVTFPQGLITSYNKELPMIQQMDGTAEIITENMRLISRFFNPIISLFKNR